MEELSKHDQKELKRKQKEQEQQKGIEEKSSKSKTKKTVKWALIIVAVVALVFFVFRLVASNKSGNDIIKNNGPYTKGQVHWHATFSVERCGIPYDLPAPIGESHIGSLLLHTHEDKRIHIEGQVWNKEDISLGNYIKNIGVENGVLNENPTCDNNPAEWKMFVNGKENSEFKDYIIQDGDKIELKLIKS